MKNESAEKFAAPVLLVRAINSEDHSTTQNVVKDDEKF
jgi:hypothetical protein